MVRHRFAKPARLIVSYGFNPHTLLYVFFFGDITVIGNGLDWNSSAFGRYRFESCYLRILSSCL